MNYLHSIRRKQIITSKTISTTIHFDFHFTIHLFRISSKETELRVVMEDFYTQWNFPNCCGTIDGKHVVLRCPNKSGSEFFNYKKSFSAILLAIVDANYNFIYIDVGTNGRVNDALVFSRSTFNLALQNNSLHLPQDGVFVGDGAFPLTRNIMKPYAMKRPLTEQEKVFNYRLSRARRVSENAFGILVSRFLVYERPLALQPPKVDKVVKATCVLDNWLRQGSTPSNPDGLLDVEAMGPGTLTPGPRDISANGMRNAYFIHSNNHSRLASEVRNKFAELFCTSETVPWQWTMI